MQELKVTDPNLIIHSVTQVVNNSSHRSYIVKKNGVNPNHWLSETPEGNIVLNLKTETSSASIIFNDTMGYNVTVLNEHNYPFTIYLNSPNRESEKVLYNFENIISDGR